MNHCRQYTAWPVLGATAMLLRRLRGAQNGAKDLLGCGRDEPEPLLDRHGLGEEMAAVAGGQKGRSRAYGSSNDRRVLDDDEGGRSLHLALGRIDHERRKHL